jgi:hypothetical protein
MKGREPRLARRLGLAVCMVLLAAGGCADATSPARVANVTIVGAPTAPLTAGDSVSLSTSVQNSQGVPVTDATVSWSSTNSAVATVSGFGILKAISPGTAQILASVEGVADTVTVTVLASANGCAGSGLSMAVGEVRRLDPTRDPAVCLPPASGDYALTAFYGQETGNVSLTVETTLAAALAGSATPSQMPASILSPLSGAGDPFLVASGPRPDWVDHMARLARGQKEIAQYMPSLRALWAKGGPSYSLAADVPTVGSTLSLNVAEGCATPTRRAARVAAVTTRAVIAEDPTNPPGAFSDAEYREFALAFDTLVYPIDVANFGEPVDLDNNGGRVVIFFTRAVNEKTPPNNDSYIGGFFNPRDILPTTATAGVQTCTGSNFGEIFYVLAADPTGAVNGNVRSKSFVQQVTVSAIAHEFKHLIGAERRTFNLKTQAFDELWLEEGLAHIAQELVFYRAAQTGPRQNIGTSLFQGAEPQRTLRINAFNNHIIGNFGNLQSYLEAPETSSPFAANDELSTRGSTWNFLRYAVDRVGGDETALWNRLVNTTQLGMANLRTALGTEPMPLFRDWSVSLYTDDLVAGVPTAYQQPTWNNRSLFPAITNARNYPLRVRPLVAGSTPLSLVAGGSAYFTITPAAGSRTNVRIRSGGIAPPSTLALHVVRTR